MGGEKIDSVGNKEVMRRLSISRQKAMREELYEQALGK
jgi:hypothetical protein